MLSVLIGTILLAAGWGLSSPPPTSYALAWREPFNRPAHYPLERRPDPALYRAHAEWMGRLLLPARQETQQRPGDWVWLELEQAPPPHAHLVGRRLRLQWQQTPILRHLVETVSTDVRLGEDAGKAAAQGNVLPTRLDGRRQVGPLQSLAGARPHDDVVVALEQVDVTDDPDGGENGIAALRIGTAPVLITGRWSALVQILGPGPDSTAAGDIFRVRHYDRARGGFEGPVETVRIPRQPPDRSGRRPFDPTALPDSAAGEEGWLIHGSPDSRGVFTVQALEPLHLFLPLADRRPEGRRAGLHHLLESNWRIRPGQRGGLSRTALGRPWSWSKGDRALVLHSFGGIGGPQGEPVHGFTVTGHFAFGEARVVTDPFSGRERFSLRYHQIYAHNPAGIISASHDWSSYAGDLQRGWLATRPFSDVLVRADPRLLPLLASQAQILMARYRSGDGTGVATVTPATSCVQDSSQALWISLELVRRGVVHQQAAMPAVDIAPDPDWSRAGGAEGSLAQDLEALLVPFGRVRDDWLRNADRVEAAVAGRLPPRSGGAQRRSGDGPDAFQRGQSPGAILLSLRSMMPRRAHDDLARLFLRRGESLWILRTNQLPGRDPAIEPMAPTLLLGRIPVLATLLRRSADALLMPLRWSDGILALLLLGMYALPVLPWGLGRGWLRWNPTRPFPRLLAHALQLLLLPSLLEEIIFRVFLLPHPLEGASAPALLGWGALSVGGFVLYHPLAARLWYPPGRPLFDHPRFLVPCAGLGGICAVGYGITGSVWVPVLIHWIVVVVWLEFLGGRADLGPSHPDGRDVRRGTTAPVRDSSSARRTVR